MKTVAVIKHENVIIHITENTSPKVVKIIEKWIKEKGEENNAN